MDPLKKIGLFGGSFDPIHFGHLHLAIRIMEEVHLDQVLFCPAFTSPFKKEAPPLPATHRLNMVKLAIQEIPQFAILDQELNRGECSYTIDTVRWLLASHPQIQLHLLLGEDMLEGFSQWKEFEELAKLAPPWIGTRRGICSSKGYSSAVYKMWEKGRVQIPSIEISSTEIRERIKKKLYCGHLLPQSVMRYILKNNLYT